MHKPSRLIRPMMRSNLLGERGAFAMDVATRWTAMNVSISNPLLSDAVPETDADPLSFGDRRDTSGMKLTA